MKDLYHSELRKKYKMEYAILGAIVAFNIIIIIWKMRHHRWIDGILDGSALVAVALVFTGGIASLIVGTIGSFIVSLYLLAFPPKFEKKQEKKKPLFTPKEYLW